MLEEIDEEMDRRSLEALLLLGESTTCNPELHYLVRTPVLRGGIYLKKKGEPPLLLVSDIDLGSAKKGVVSNVKTYTDYGYYALLSKYPPERALIDLIRRLLREYGVSGRISFSGRSEVGRIISVTERLKKYGYRVVGEDEPPILKSLMATKSREEIEGISRLGRTVEEVMKEALDLIGRSKRHGNILRHGGEDLTVGRIKSEIRVSLSRYNLSIPEDFIFSISSRSADPHHLGEESDVIKTGEPIVFDLYPYDRSGYCFDTTRTYIIGEADPRIKEMYTAVLEAQESAIAEACEGEMGSSLMNLVCDLMAKKGFKTVRDLVQGDGQASHRGFVHSLGHGVGWTLSDKPTLSLYSKERLQNGNVFTVEPGLYNPRVGGVRLEDVVALIDGEARNLSSLERELEI